MMNWYKRRNEVKTRKPLGLRQNIMYVYYYTYTLVTYELICI